jgi:two-component system chemotaxis response regulator CheB
MYTKYIVIVGSSTGGFSTVEGLFPSASKLNACFIVVQHMLKSVNLPFKNYLRGITDMEVKIAEDGDTLEAGKVYIAPSGLHLKIEENKRIRLFNDEKVNATRPSIDVSMKSLKEIPGNTIIGVVLTGMGKDGAEGISHIKNIGGITIAQDKDTSVIFGMPGAAIETGDIDFSLPPEKIREKLIEIAGILNSE